MRKIGLTVLIFFFFLFFCLTAGIAYKTLRPYLFARTADQDPASQPPVPGREPSRETPKENPGQPQLSKESQGQPQPPLSEPQSHYLPVISNRPVVPFTFIAWGDTKAGLAELAQLSNQAVEFSPVFTLFSGDLEGYGFTQAGMVDWLWAMSGAKGNGLTEIVFPTRGNHDILNQQGWQDFFSLNYRAYALGIPNYSSLDEDLTYSFDYSNAHFVALDIPGDVEIITERQLDFLDKDLARAESRKLAHAFLFFHGPIYATGAHSSCAERVCPLPPEVMKLVEVLNRHPIVAAVFNGHEHLQAYVHMDSSRIPEIVQPFEQIISGAAGAELHSCMYPERADYCESYHGFTVVSVNGKNFSVSFYQIGQAEPVKVYDFSNE